jgi:hypothetical protein
MLYIYDFEIITILPAKYGMAATETGDRKIIFFPTKVLQI